MKYLFMEFEDGNINWVGDFLSLEEIDGHYRIRYHLSPTRAIEICFVDKTWVRQYWLEVFDD